MYPGYCCPPGETPIRLDIGSPEAAEFTLEELRNRQHDIFSPWTGNDLDADGQAFRGRAASNDCAGPAGQVVSHCVAERSQILTVLTTVAHCGNSIDRAQDDIVAFHE